MRASQATMLLSIAAALAWCGPSEVFAQAAGGYVSAELSADASSSQLSCDDEEPYAGPDASAAYTSALYVGDINLRWQWRERIALISGFRMGQLNEHYRANGTATGGGDAYALNTDAFNHLYGFQLGADATVLDFGGPLKLKGICRAGAFANYASQRDSLTESEMQTEVNASRNNHMAFLGEAGAVLTYAITKNLSFRASYEAMWLEGVALAPEQISSSNLLLGTASVNANGSVFYHGGGLGVEYRY